MEEISENVGKNEFNFPEKKREFIVVGDPFRTSADHANESFSWLAEDNCKWIARLLRASLLDCPDVQVRIAPPEQFDVAPPDFTQGSHVDDMRRWLEQAMRPVENHIAEKARQTLAGKIVIGIELPAHFRALVEECAEQFIGIELSPLRFTEEFLLRVEAPEPIRNILNAHAVLGQDLRQIARLLALKIGDVSAEGQHLPDRFALIAAQVQYDRSLIREETFLTLADFTDEVKALVDRHGTALVLLHPHTRFVAGLQALCDIKGLRIGTGNGYRLLVGRQVAELATVSSSLGAEARFFGVPATVWAKPSGDGSEEGVELTATSFVELLGSALCGNAPIQKGAKMEALRGDRIFRKDVVHDWGLPQALQARDAISTFPLHAPQGTISGADSSFASALTCGWHPPEEWGVWGNHDVSILSFSWPETNIQELAIILELTSLAKMGQLTKDIDVFVDGHRVATVEAPSSFSSTKTLIRIPCTGQQFIQLWLRCEPVVPQDLDASRGDLRTIGVGLLSVAWKKLV